MDAVFQFDHAVGDGDEEVFVEVSIGDAQLGASVVLFDGRILAKGTVITDLRLGTAAEVRGKSLFVKSIVSDVNDRTNWTSVRYVLRRGVGETPFHAQIQVPNEGDSVVYRTTFDLR